MSKNKWRKASFKIKTVSVKAYAFNGGEPITEETFIHVKGLSNGRFGVDWRKSEGSWVLTHLPTGWRCLQFAKKSSAVAFGELLDARFGDQMSAIKTNGFEVENFKEVQRMVSNDPDLMAIWNVDGVSSPYQAHVMYKHIRILN